MSGRRNFVQGAYQELQQTNSFPRWGQGSTAIITAALSKVKQFSTLPFGVAQAVTEMEAYIAWRVRRQGSGDLELVMNNASAFEQETKEMEKAFDKIHSFLKARGLSYDGYGSFV